jgi:TolB-like protein
MLRLTPKALDLLIVLVKNSGRLLDKEELIRAVWPDTFVEESNLSSNISALRKLLGVQPSGAEYIETIPKRGYRFAGSTPLPQNTATVSTSSEPRVTIQNSRLWRGAPLLAFVTLSLLVAVLLAWTLTPRHSGKVPDSLVVLRFVSQDLSEEDRNFSEGFAEELTSRFNQFNGIHVARAPVDQFSGTFSEVVRAANTLHAIAVLECTLNRSGSNLGLTARLVRLSDNRQLWSATLDRQPEDILILQDNVVRAVLQALPITTAPAALSTLRYPRSIEAHALILRARYLKSKVTKESIERAIALFYEAIEKQPDSAAAYGGIAQCYTALAFSGQVAPNEAIPKAISAAQTALVIDQSQAEAHAAQAIINLIFLWDWSAAEREFIESLRLDPDLVEGHHWYSHYLIVKGDFDRSLEESRQAQQLGPLDLLASAHLGWHYWYAGQFDRALNALNSSVELESNQFWAWRYLRWVREQREEFDKAVDAVQHGGTSEKQVGELRRNLEHFGPAGYWRTQLDESLIRSRHQYVSAYPIAQIYARMGQTDEVFKWLDRSYQQRDSALIYLRYEPAFAKLHQDPRFLELVDRMKLP